jgi:hypothetical protein
MDVISPLHLAGATWTLATRPLARDAVVGRVHLLVLLEMALHIIQVVEHDFTAESPAAILLERLTVPISQQPLVRQARSGIHR